MVVLNRGYHRRLVIGHRPEYPLSRAEIQPPPSTHQQTEEKNQGSFTLNENKREMGVAFRWLSMKFRALFILSGRNYQKKFLLLYLLYLSL